MTASKHVIFDWETMTTQVCAGCKMCKREEPK